MRAMNGNGGAARTSARKRQQKAPSFSLQDLMKLFQHLSVILQMLKGHDLGQLLSMFTDFVPVKLDGKQKEHKRKHKVKKGTGKSPSTGVGTKASDKPAPADPQPRSFADVAKSGQATAQTQPSKPVSKSHPAEFTPVWRLRQSDWNGEIHTYDSLASLLPEAQKDVSCVVQVFNEDELNDLRTLVEAGSDALTKVGVTAVLLGSKQDIANDPKNLTQIPGLRGGKVVPRLAHLIQVGEDNGPKVQKMVQTVAAQPTVADTTVVRLSTEARYHQPDKWKYLVDNAAPLARKWLQTHVPDPHLRKIRDLWGTQLETSKGGGQAIITASLRIEKTALHALLALSGRDAWFVEAMRWDYGNVPPCTVNWIKRNQNESGPDYASRVASLSGTLGIARGWKSLGTRVPKAPGAPDQPRTYTWKITGVPRDWGHDCIVAQMTQAGLSDVQVTSRRTYGRYSVLFATARGQEKLDFLEFEFQNVTVLATAQAPSRGARTMKQSLKSTSGVSFGANDTAVQDRPKSVHRSFYPDSPLKKKVRTEAPLGTGVEEQNKAVAATQLDEDQKEDENMPQKEGEGGISDAGAGVKTPQRRIPDGMVAVPNSGKGNCIFEAIGQALNPDKPKPHMSVRSSVISHLKRHESRYKPWWDQKNPNGEVGTTWENYIKLLNKNMAWGGALEIAAAAAHFDKAIHVLGPHMVHSEVYNRNAKGEPICLWYHKEHYEWLKGKTPAVILAGESCNGPLQGGRGGSVDSASCSGVTRQSALPDSKRPSVGRPVSTKSGGGATRVSALPQEPVSVSTPRYGEFSVAFSEAMAAADPDEVNLPGSSTDSKQHSCITKPRRQGRIVEWICPYCKVTITGKNLYNRKKDHLKAWHPDKRQEARLVQTLQVKEVHDTDVYWKCPLCSCGLTHEQRKANNVSRLRDAMLRHKKAKHDKAPMKGFSFKAGVRVKESLKRAHAAVRNKAAMSRILKGKSSRHKVTFFNWPTWWTNRENRQDVLCSRCKRLSRSVQELDKSECKVDSSFLGRRQAFLNKLLGLLSEEPVDRAPKLKEMISQLTFSEPRAVGDHEMRKFDKPAWLKLPRADNTFCIKCKRLAGMYKSLADIPCNGPLPAFRRKRLFDNMAKTVGRSTTRRKEMKQLIDILSTNEPATHVQTSNP